MRVQENGDDQVAPINQPVAGEVPGLDNSGGILNTSADNTSTGVTTKVLILAAAVIVGLIVVLAVL